MTTNKADFSVAIKLYKIYNESYNHLPSGDTTFSGFIATYNKIFPKDLSFKISFKS